MRLLALDTATEACSVALWEQEVVHERYEVAPRRHAELVLPMIDELLAAAGWTRRSLDALALGRGPGSFTGVRLAASVAQGIAFALDLPVAPVSTLAALARRAWRERAAAQVLALIDARMEEVYWGSFAVAGDGSVRALGPERVSAPAAVAVDGEGWLAAGSGWDRYGDVLRARGLGDGVAGLLPHAHDVAEIGAAMCRRGETVPAADALPVYVRNRVAKKPGQQVQ